MFAHVRIKQTSLLTCHEPTLTAHFKRFKCFVNKHICMTKPKFNIHQVLSYQFTEEQRRGATEFGQKIYDGPQQLYFMTVDPPHQTDKRGVTVANIKFRFRKGVMKDLKSAGISHESADGFIGYICLSGKVDVLLDKSRQVDEILNKYADKQI